MNCLNRSLSKNGAIAGVGVEVPDIAGVGVGVLLPSVGAVLTG